MSIITVRDHKGNQFNVARASAVDQKSLLLMLGARLTMSKQHIESKDLPPGTLEDTGFIMSMIMSLPESEFSRIETLLGVDRLIPHGEEKPIDIKHFSTNMTGYFHVLANLVRENLQDFFTWLNSDQNEE